MGRMVAGERLWSGVIVTAELAAVYNRTQDKIEAYRAAGKKPPEELLNGAFNLVNLVPVKTDRERMDRAIA